MTPFGDAPLPEEGDPSEDVVYASVGFALSRWEAMEANMCWLYAALTGSERYSTEAITGYSKQSTLKGRLDQVANALCSYAKKQPNHSFECGVHDIIDEVKTEAGNRNKIAHAVIAILRQKRHAAAPGSMINMPYDAEYCLVPAYYNYRYVNAGMRPKYVYVSSGIRLIGNRFEQLGTKILAFTDSYFPPRPSLGT